MLPVFAFVAGVKRERIPRMQYDATLEGGQFANQHGR